jgi:hypothetical protein
MDAPSKKTGQQKRDEKFEEWRYGQGFDLRLLRVAWGALIAA